MPLYEYRCSKCGKTFEKIEKFSDKPLEVHEDCGGKVERLISTSALQFKGSGWYVNDYAKGSSKSEGKKSEKSDNKSSDNKGSDGKTSDSSSESKSSETKTDSKPAASTKSE